MGDGKKSNVTTRRFSSIGALVDYALDQAPETMRPDNRRTWVDLARENRGRSWYGLDNAAAVRAAVLDGYEQGARQVDDMLAAVRPHIPRAIDISRKRMKGDQGESLDIHAVYRGDLSRAWEKVGRAFTPQRSVIRIGVDLCANAWADSSALAWRGVAALALSSALGKARYSVEIVAGFCTSNSARQVHPGEKHSQGYTMLCPIKSRGEIGNTLRLAGTACVSGFGRYVMLSAMVRIADEEGRTVDNGLGHAVALADRMPKDDRVAQFVVPASVMDRANAEKWVRETLAVLQNVSIKGER